MIKLNYLMINFLIFLLILKQTRQNDLHHQAYTYRLIGSSNSYAQYLPWYPCLNGSITFEFKTHEPNGLLLYAQSLPYKYLQISLVEGNLRLRMRIGEKDNPRGIFLVYQSTRLNDEKWHEIRLQRHNEKTILTIDGENLYHVHKDASLTDLFFGDYKSSDPSNMLFIGGIADNLQTYDLSLGTALFEPRFNGFIRNLRALNCSHQFMQRLYVMTFNSLRFVAEHDYCASNPCLNNGVCSIVTSSSVSFRCDCTYTNYEGDLCEILKPPISSEELTFTGKEYFSLNIPKNEKNKVSSIIPTYEEEYNLDFKTSRSTGLLIYAGDSVEYFILGLQDGALYFKLNIKGQSFDKTLTVPGTHLHNNHWHSIKFTRRTRQIEIVIDNLKKDQSNLTGEFISMQTRIVYIGGVPKENTIYKSIRKNFIGCLRNVTYKSDVNSFNLISMVLNESVMVDVQGKLDTGCRKVMQPITFSSPNSYIPILDWKDYPKINSFTIEFQTTENNGVLAYILGSENSNSHSSQNTIQSKLLSFNRDFFSLEIHNRFLNAYFNLGTNYVRHEVVHEHVSTGKSHQVTVEINDKYAIFRFDQKPETSIRIDSSDSDLLELSGPLIIGGLHPNHTSPPGTSPSLRIPPYFYSGMLGNGYVGCIQDVEINGQSVNLTYYAAVEGVSGVNTDTCTPMPNQCDIGHCLNEGVCMEGWNRFVCDCSSTGFNGPICNQPATIADFDEGQHIRISFEPEWISESEHLSLRFKTEKKLDSILFSTYSKYSKDLMELSLESCQIKLFIKIGTSESSLISNEGLCDNEWHTVKITREGARIILQVDNDDPATSMLERLEHSHMQLNFDYLEIGFSSRTITPNQSYRSLGYESINLGSQFIKHKTSGQITVKTTGSFIGQMQQLIINGKSYFELIDNEDLEDSVNITATFIRSDIPNKYPLTFANTHSWLALPKIDAFHTLLIQFHFKTTIQTGLIMFNKGYDNDFMSIELHSGQVYFQFNLDSRIYRIKSRTKEKLSDNKWHLVSVWRSTKTNFELTVDSVVFKLSIENTNDNLELNLIDNLYIGSFKNASEFDSSGKKYHILSKHGFKGCLASIEINGRVPDFDEYLHMPDRIGGSVSKGCENPFDCLPNTCKNSGLCIEKWDENKKICDCDATTFTGENCELRSKGINISRGVINFENKSPMYWQEDTLTFGIETKTKEALLFRAYSGRTNKTILVELSDGYAQAIFVDLHGTTYLHTFKNYRINNNRYHILHMNVIDYNSSFRIDGNLAKKEIANDNKYNPAKKYRQLPNSNDQSLINIEIAGSKHHVEIRQDDSNEAHFFNNFNGNIYGLVYNKFRILDLLAQNDTRIKSFGRLELIEETNMINDDLKNSKIDCENDCEKTDLSSASFSAATTTAITKLKDKSKPKTTKQKSNLDLGSKSTKQMTIETMTDSTTIQASVSNLDTSSSNTASRLNETLLSTNYLIAIVSASIFILIVLIYAFCKYRNLDEGTYTIDESKNCGPFAELDTPLNGTSGKKLKNKRKPQMLNANNKEWYV